MEHPETHRVTPENGVRPAGKDNECFYCHQPLGTEHLVDCALRTRTVLVEYRVLVVKHYPTDPDWDAHLVEFQINDGSWCCSTILGELESLDERDGRCLCANVHATYVREATSGDEERYGVVKS